MTRSNRSDTKYGTQIEDHDWSKPAADSDETSPVVNVSRHTIQIDDQRDAHGYEYGLDWLFQIEDGVVTGYYLGHWLEGRTQSDPMRSPPWDDVPLIVKRQLRAELNVDTLETNLPDHYRQ